MTAAEVKKALRRRHPATQPMGSRTIPGQWTTVEEFAQIDLLAFSAHQYPPGYSRKVRYPRVGYEVKVSRRDLRAELLNPTKRERAVMFCHFFYLAVPRGLLKPQEVEWNEPSWFRDPATFRRQRCPEGCYRDRTRRESRRQYGRWEHGHERDEARNFTRTTMDWVVCETCAGKGYTGLSRAEREAPTLWVPADVGLVEVTERAGCHVVREAPVNGDAIGPDSFELSQLVRWVSARPDPRHAGLVDRARTLGRQFAADDRERRELRAAYAKADVEPPRLEG